MWVELPRLILYIKFLKKKLCQEPLVNLLKEIKLSCDENYQEI